MKQIFESRQERLQPCKTGKVFINVNERVFDDVIVVHGEGEEAEEQTVTRYEYDVEEVHVKSFSEDNVLAALKDKVIKQINAFDISSEVNAFYVNGERGWLGKTDRSALLSTLSILEKKGNESYSLWLGTTKITMPIASFRSLIEDLEVYATEAFGVTAQHIASVMVTETIEDVMSIDYKQGYPNKLTISL